MIVQNWKMSQRSLLSTKVLRTTHMHDQLKTCISYKMKQQFLQSFFIMSSKGKFKFTVCKKVLVYSVLQEAFPYSAKIKIIVSIGFCI